MRIAEYKALNHETTTFSEVGGVAIKECYVTSSLTQSVPNTLLFNRTNEYTKARRKLKFHVTASQDVLLLLVESNLPTVMEEH